METLFDREDFFSVFGIRDVRPHLEGTGEATHTVITTGMDDGVIRALLFRVVKTEKGFKVQARYFYHGDALENKLIKFLDLECVETEDGIELTSAKSLDKNLDVKDPAVVDNLAHMVSTYFRSVGKHNEWINPVALLEEYGFLGGGVGKKAWPGLYATGDFKKAPSVEVESESEHAMLGFPAFFLPAILGVGPESYAGVKQKKQVLTYHHKGGETNGRKVFNLSYDYRRGKNQKSFKVVGEISSFAAGEQSAEQLYEVHVRPHPKRDDLAEIYKLSFMGQHIDLTDRRAVSVVSKVIRNLNRSIRAGDQVLLEDLARQPQDRRLALPSEVMLHTDAYRHLSPNIKMPKAGIMTFRALGGNNIRKQVSDTDLNIGANQYILTYEWVDEGGQKHSEAIMIDAGVLFHDSFDVTFYNASRYLRHKTDKTHTPDQPVSAILFTHKHLDHLGQLAYLVKAGYELPVIHLNEMTMLQLKREMSTLKIERDIRDEILSKCYTTSMTKSVNPRDPEKREKVKIAGTEIERWTEVIPGEKLGEVHHYPVLQIGKFQIRVGPMPHSDPGFMYDIITPAGSHRHTGDYKHDSEILLDMPPLDPWLKAWKPDSLSADSTGTTKEGHNPTEKDVRDSIVSLLNEHAGKRFIFPTLGSNYARLVSLVAAMGETDCKTLIIDGKAVQDLVRDADKTDGFRKWAKRALGVKVLISSQKEAKALVAGKKKDERYAIAVTGTQDEPLSSINRAARDWLSADRYSLSDDDVVCFIQGVIPVGTNRWRRWGLHQEVEKFHGAMVLMPEVVEKESELILHSSGHSCREDCKRTIELSDMPFVIPVHGGPDQLKGHIEIADELGADSILVSGTEILRIEKGKKVSMYHALPLELIGVTLHTPSPEKFYLKDRFSLSTMPMKPWPTTSGAELLEDFETSILADAGISSDYELRRSLPLMLSPKFNAVSVNGFLTQDMDFGIQKYKKRDVFEDKDIFVVAGYDTETTGLDPDFDRIREFGMTVQDARTRRKVEQVEFKQAIPEYVIPSPEALLVTGFDPEEMRDGMNGVAFAKEMVDRISGLKKTSQELAQKHKICDVRRHKVLMIAHNAPFDSRFMQRELGRNLEPKVRVHESDGMLSVDTRNISRAMLAYFPEKYTVDTNPETEMPDHRLESLCKANGVPYNTAKSHGALYDTKPCLDLFWYQYGMSPELVGQMIVNADSATNHLLNDINGVANGFNGPHPVFSYVSHHAARPFPQMGCSVGTLDDDRYVIVFNLKYDPNDYINKPTEEIVRLMKDKDSDVFEVLDLRKQPIIVPAKFGFKVRANGALPKETLDQRAGAIKRHINHVSPKAGWRTISQKIDEAWTLEREALFSSRLIPPYPDVFKRAGKLSKKAPMPETGIQQLLKIKAKIGFNPIYKKVYADVRDYLAVIRDGRKTAATKAYRSLKKHRQHLGNAMDTINNIHYDIEPKDLTIDDRRRVEDMRNYTAHILYGRALDGVNKIKRNTERTKKFIGRSTKKRALFKKIQYWLSEREHLKRLDDRTKGFVHPQREYTLPDRKVA